MRRIPGAAGSSRRPATVGPLTYGTMLELDRARPGGLGHTGADGIALRQAVQIGWTLPIRPGRGGLCQPGRAGSAASAGLVAAGSGNAGLAAPGWQHRTDRPGQICAGRIELHRAGLH